MAGPASVDNDAQARLTATVLKGHGNQAGMAITFEASGGGRLQPAQQNTDDTGTAATTCTTPAQGTGTATVTAIVTDPSTSFREIGVVHFEYGAPRLASTYTGTGNYDPNPASIPPREVTLVLEQGAVPGYPMSSVSTVARKAPLNFSSSSNAPQFAGSLRTGSRIAIGFLVGNLQSNGSITGEWSNFDAGGTVFRFTVTGGP